MSHLSRAIPVFLVMALAFSLVQCGPPAGPETAVPVEEPDAETPSQEPAATATPPEPTAPPPTPEPEVTIGWSTHSSTASLLSFGHPGEWFGPAQLPFGEGVYVEDPNVDIGVLFQFQLTGDPAQLLAAWGSSPIDVVGVVFMEPEGAENADPVTISRIETPTRLMRGSGLVAQTAFIQRAQDVMQVMWYAPADDWDSLQDTFSDILETVEIWRKYNDQGLQTMYLHDWPAPTVPWEGSGLWFHNEDGSTGMALRFDQVADPVQLLAAWTPDVLAGLGFTGCQVPAPGNRVRGLGGDWESRTGTCLDAAGTGMTYEVAYLADRDRTVETIVYAPTAQWDETQAVFDTMLGLLVDIR